MLVVSLALHVGVGVGIALSYFRGAPAPIAVACETEHPTAILLRSEESPLRHSRLPAAAKVIEPAASLATAAPPLPVPVPKILSTVIAPPSLALEANPNAHVRSLPPEAVLSPNPAPQLDSTQGIVFILDISGSMYEPFAGSTRLAFARQALSQQIRALKDGTPFAITLYAQRACTSGPLVAARDATREAAVRFIMRDVDCGGGTNLPAGFASAQQLRPGALVLATDGDLNISAYQLADKTRDLLGPEGHCPILTVIGIAPRVNKGADRLLQGLADEQGGTYCAEQIAGRDASPIASLK